METTLAEIPFEQLARQLKLSPVQIQNVVALIDEGWSVPFLAHYRLDHTHGASERVLSRLAQELGQTSLDVALGTAVSWYRDVLGAALGVASTPRNADLADAIGRVATARPPTAVLRQLALVGDTVEALEQNANRQLALETMLLGLRAIDRQRGAH